MQNFSMDTEKNMNHRISWVMIYRKIEYFITFAD